MRLNTAITQFRQSLGLKVSYGLRAFALYILLLGGLGWFLLDHAVERLNDGMRQAAEHVMVDNVNILAAMLEQHAQDTGSLDASTLANVLEQAKQRVFLAKIYQVDKFAVNTDLYVTDHKGIVLYDSRYRDVGKDYSQWRDVKLALSGEYGARTSFIDDEPSVALSQKFAQRLEQTKNAQDGPKAMIVAAPIRQAERIIGAVSLLTPINSLERHVATETAQLKRTMLLALVVAIVCGFFLSVLFGRSINKIAVYANKMAMGETVEPPKLLDQRLADLTGSVANLRNQLDGKEYVEQYIHGLTHELKTPITGIRGAVELINEGLPENDQARFLANIQSSNERMARLVDRMLSLAKLESQTVLINTRQFNLNLVVERLINERQPMLDDKNLTINLSHGMNDAWNGHRQPLSEHDVHGFGVHSFGDHLPNRVTHHLSNVDSESKAESTVKIKGDPVLLSQAIANVLDNAIHYAHAGSELQLSYQTDDGRTRVAVVNQGQCIPDYALEKIFERFFSLPSEANLHHAAAGHRKSTGLGLRFVKEIMKLHAGQVTVTNHATGVTAELTWPLT